MSLQQSLLSADVKKYIGWQGERFAACDVIERGAVRRYAQAIMELDPAYDRGVAQIANGVPVAPLLYPIYMFRTPFEAVDYITERANDPHFDGLVPGVGNGLPELPLPGLALLNGGGNVELFRYPEHGERIYQQSKYVDIYERVSRSGPMLFVIIETVYSGENGHAIMHYTKTLIRR